MNDDGLFLGQHILGVAPPSLLLSDPAPPGARLVHLEEDLGSWTETLRLRGTNPPGAREALVQIQQAPAIRGGASDNTHSSTASSSGLPRNSFGGRLQSALSNTTAAGSGDPAQIDRPRPLGEPREQKLPDPPRSWRRRLGFAPSRRKRSVFASGRGAPPTSTRPTLRTPGTTLKSWSRTGSAPTGLTW